MEESRLGKVARLDDVAGIDWLSTLCDDLLIELLSYMSLKQAGQTHGLSRRWRHLWSFRKDLVFRVDKGENLAGITASAETVDGVIAHYRGPKIGEFHLNIQSQTATAAQIDSWIRFAIGRDVESIWLARWEPEKFYKVTPELFRGKFLMSLYLHNCHLRVLGTVCLSSLKSFSLSHSKFPRDFFAKFTSGCPVLKEVSINKCNRYLNITVDITNPSVQILKIRDCTSYGYRSDSIFKLNAPNVLYFRLKGVASRRYLLVNVSSLVEAEVDVKMFSRTDVLLLKKLLSSLSCEKLKLCSWCIQILTLSRSAGEPFSKLPVTCLDLSLPLLKCEMIGLFYLLQISPKVESLTINFGFWDDGMNEESFLLSSMVNKRLDDYIISDFWTNLGDDMNGENDGEDDAWALMDAFAYVKLPNLKTIELVNFHGLGYLGAINSKIPKATFTAIRGRQIQLLKLLLQHSPLLEVLNIHFPPYHIPPFSKFYTYELNEQVVEMRSSIIENIKIFPRASAEAKICFC